MFVFADAVYFIAVLNPRDANHERAVEWNRTSRSSIITTSWVLVEVGDAMASPLHRPYFLSLMKELQNNTRINILDGDRNLFDAGLELYARRSDKDWTLTDCISFAAMTELNILSALTADHHFEQAGFSVLL